MGFYKAVTNEFEVDNTDFMEGITDWRYDYGSKYYASKTFFDGEKKRQTLWVRILEADGKANDKKKRVVRASGNIPIKVFLLWTYLIIGLNMSFSTLYY